jgi:gas vesicle protein
MGNGNNNGKLMGAILLGAAIGGVLGILFAPDKGSETRKKISSKGNDLTDAVKDKFNNIADKFKKEMEDLKDQAGEFAQNGKSVIDDLKKNQL